MVASWENAVNGNQVQRPTEPVLAAIKPFLHKGISIWTFYWKLAWRPRQFAEEYLQVPTAALITKSVKQTLWLAGFWSAMVSLSGSVAGLMGVKAGPLSGFVMTFVTVTLIGLQVIPMAGMLWLLARRFHTSISQALLVFVSTFNLFLGATLLIYSIIGAIGVPFQLFVYYFRFPGETRQTDPDSFVAWFSASSYWKLYIALLSIMGVSCVFAWGRIFFLTAPAVIAGMLKTSYWHGLWRLLVSITVPVIVIEGLFMSILTFLMWIIQR